MKTTSTPRTQEAPSCFEAALRAFLRRSHPELLSDNDFILRRSEDAAATFSRGRRDGHSVYEALELSRAVLYDGLRFLALRHAFRSRLRMVPGNRAAVRTSA